MENDRLANGGYPEQFRVIIKVCEWAEEKLKTEEINNKLLFDTDNEGMST